MKRGLLLLIVAVALLGTIGGGAAYAQQISIVNIPFTFVANNKEMAPGTYEITVSDQAVLSLTPTKGQQVFVPTITRLALHQQIKDPTVVFDKMGEKYVLSELWVPDEDGYLVTDTKEPHQHHVLKGKKKT